MHLHYVVASVVRIALSWKLIRAKPWQSNQSFSSLEKKTFRPHPYLSSPLNAIYGRISHVSAQAKKKRRS